MKYILLGPKRCSIFVVDPQAVRPSRPSGGAHLGLPRQALLPSHGHHEQADIPGRFEKKKPDLNFFSKVMSLHLSYFDLPGHSDAQSDEAGAHLRGLQEADKDHGLGPNLFPSGYVAIFLPHSPLLCQRANT